MDRTWVVVLVLLATGVVAFGLSLLVRRSFPQLASANTSPWSSTLSYVATAYGVVVGFSILFLFGEFADAREAVGQEATAIGTAFEEARLFPDDAAEIQHALICYARAVPEFEWQALRDRRSAPEVDRAYRDIVLALRAADQPTESAFQPATATNIVVQVGNISTARAIRLVAAEDHLPGMLWALLLGGGVFVVGMIFVVTLPERSGAQAVLVGLSATFTAVLVLIIFALSSPYSDGAGRITPRLIEETTAVMESAASETATRPCDFGDGSRQG